MDPFLPSPSTVTPLYTPNPVPIPPPAATSTRLPSSPVVPPTPPVSPSSGDGSDGHVLVLSDDSGSVYTTTIYSTQPPHSPIDSTSANVHQTPQFVPNFAAIIAGVGGGVGLLLLVIGVVWYVWARRTKRRTGITLIKERKFYPDRYNQTMTSSRHSEFNEIEPSPVVVQPLPHPPPPLLPRYPSILSSGPLSRQASSYQNHVPPSCIHGNWAGAPPTDGILEGPPPLARHRVPFPSSPVQSQVDRYTMLPSRSPSTCNSPTTLRFVLNTPPRRPHHFRPPSATHRRYHSHQSYYNRPQYHECDSECDSHFAPIHAPRPSPPTPMRMARRYTVFVSPPMSPASFSTVSSPLDHPAARVEPVPTTLTPRPSIAHSKTDSLFTSSEAATTKRMMVTNPDLDVDIETDTEPERSSFSGRRGSPSATEIIRLYGRDLDRHQNTSSSSVLEGKDTPTVSISPVPVSSEGG